MSKLYKKYLELKKTNSSKIYLFRSGLFYIFIEDDAYIMSKFLNLRLTNLNESVVKCGFPVSVLNKYLNLIKAFNYNIVIIDTLNSTPLSCNNYISNEKMKELINKLSLIDSNNLSIKEIYSLVDDLSNQAKEIKNEVEY